MSKESITKTDVEHIASLARLRLTEEEVTTMTQELSAILDYVAALEKADLSDVEPTLHSVELNARLREDEAIPVLRRSEVLSQAPSADAGGFAVPKVLEG